MSPATCDLNDESLARLHSHELKPRAAAGSADERRAARLQSDVLECELLRRLACSHALEESWVL